MYIYIYLVYVNTYVRTNYVLCVTYVFMIRPMIVSKRDILRNFQLRFITDDTDFRFIIYIIRIRLFMIRLCYIE